MFEDSTITPLLAGIPQPDQGTVIRLDPVCDHISALPSSRWRVHPEPAYATAIHRGVGRISGGEGQMLEDRGVKHSHSMEPI